MQEIIFPHLSPDDVLHPYPVIQKNGIISNIGGEMSLFVRNGQLMCLENLWSGKDGDGKSQPCARIFDYFTGEGKTENAPVGGDGPLFYSAFGEGERVYVFATQKNCVYRYVSDDLQTWKKSLVLTFPDNFTLFNTAVCRGEDGYRMAIEGGCAEGKENPYIGVPFTEFFASSHDLEKWELLPLDKSYTKERYCACPALKYCGGYYYMICLEALPAMWYVPYIYRTRDFETWEIGFYNPLFVPSAQDLYPKAGVALTEKTLTQNFRHINTNNSDVDLCEYGGKTYIVYCSGNQGNTWGGYSCEAVYDGPLDAFLQANFA